MMAADRWGCPRTPYVYPATQNGYYVRLPVTVGGKRQWFGNKRHGDPAHAYAAALAWRDRRLPASHNSRVLRHDKGRPGNSAGRGPQERAAFTLGKAGIEIGNFGASRAYDNADLHVKATARAPGSNSPLARSFSINRYGLANAVLYAVRARLAWEVQHYAHRSRLGEREWLAFILRCYAQFGRDKAYLEHLNHPGSVSSPDGGGLQARVSVRGRLESAWFAYRAYANRYETRVAAILWCIDNRARRAPAGGKHGLKADRRNRTTGVAGVRRTGYPDR